jgi:hypothetical protein
MANRGFMDAKITDLELKSSGITENQLKNKAVALPQFNFFIFGELSFSVTFAILLRKMVW